MMDPPTKTAELLALCRNAVPTLVWDFFPHDNNLRTRVWALIPGAQVQVCYLHQREQHVVRIYASLETPGESFEPTEARQDVLSVLRLVAEKAAYSLDPYWTHVGRALRDLLDQLPTATELG